MKKPLQLALLALAATAITSVMMPSAFAQAVVGAGNCSAYRELSLRQHCLNVRNEAKAEKDVNAKTDLALKSLSGPTPNAGQRLPDGRLISDVKGQIVTIDGHSSVVIDGPGYRIVNGVGSGLASGWGQNKTGGGSGGRHSAR